MRAYILGGLVASVVLLAAGTTAAHHSFSAEFDANKPITLKGVVTKVEWTNPHVWFYVNVKDEKTGEVSNWGAEMGPPHGLQRQGWRRETLKIGEVVTTHSFDDRRATVERVGRTRMKTCSGGIVGMGETPQQRNDLPVHARLRLVPFPRRRVRLSRPGGAGDGAAALRVPRVSLRW